jgi:hypothetical protein
MIAKLSLIDIAVIAQRFHSDFEAIAKRLQSDCIVIAKRSLIDEAVNAQRFHSDREPIGKRLRSDLAAIVQRLSDFKCDHIAIRNQSCSFLIYLHAAFHAVYDYRH